MLWENKDYDGFSTGIFSNLNEQELVTEAEKDSKNKPTQTSDVDDEDYDLGSTGETEDDGSSGFNPNGSVQQQNANNSPTNEPAPQAEENEDDGEDENYELGDEGVDPDDRKEEPVQQNTGDETQQQQSEENSNTEENDNEDSDDENYELGDVGEDTSAEDEGEGTGDGDQDDEEDGAEVNTSSSETNDDEGTNSIDPRQRLKELEDSIFDQLPEDQKAAKNKELKNIFNSVYYNCQKISDEVDQIMKTPENVKVYEYITNTLSDLMQYIKDYLTNNFNNRTYMENVVEFEKYLAVLDGIKKVLVDLKNKQNKEDKEA